MNNRLVPPPSDINKNIVFELMPDEDEAMIIKLNDAVEVNRAGIHPD